MLKTPVFALKLAHRSHFAKMVVLKGRNWKMHPVDGHRKGKAGLKRECASLGHSKVQRENTAGKGAGAWQEM